MSETKTDKELALDLTIELIKARGEVIASMSSVSTQSNKLSEWLGTSAVNETFEQIYSTIESKK